MEPHQLPSATPRNGQQQIRYSESGTIWLAGNVAGEPLAESLGQLDSGDTTDPEQITTTTHTPKAPWWRRPSPWWLLAIIPFTSIAASAKVAPRLEIYTVLACSVHKPDIIAGQGFPGTSDSLKHVSGLSVLTHFRGLDSFFDAGGTSRPFNASTCASDPVVQAAVAKLIAVLSACTGFLSLLTTGYWGAYSDRHGRARVMGISIIGLLLDDLNFILVTNFPRLVPGGYWFLVVGAIIDGCLGGFTTGVAAVHTYLTDTTDEHDRSRILSLNIGLLFFGVAAGPALGSVLIRSTGQALFVFYAAAIFTLLYAFLLWFILPESITEHQMARARVVYNDDLLRGAPERGWSSTPALLHKIWRASSFLSPLAVFLPSSLKNLNNTTNQNRRDWSLTILALAYGCTISILGSYQNKLQYAASEFSWSTEMIGYWLSLNGATRAFVMILILPVAIKLFKKKSFNGTPPTDPNPSEVTRLLDPLGDDPSSSIRGASVRSKVDSASFDLGLAKLSLVVDIISFLGMAFARTGWQFTIFSVLSSFGLGFNPAMQSVTLALYTRRGGTEAGRLFGALSVIQAASQILGSALYGFVYARTVAMFPRAIFFVTVVTVITSLVLLLLVRLPDKLEYQSDSVSVTGDRVREADLSGIQNSNE